MTAVSDRTFGVEIECGVPSSLGGSDCTCDEETLDYYGCECAGGDACYATEAFLERHGFQDWAQVSRDGTEVEIHGPILSGQAGLDELHAVLTLLKKHGFYVTTSDGMHVHHGAEEFVDNADLIERLVESWVANQENIDHLVVDYRRGDYWACPAWGEEKMRFFKDDIAVKKAQAQRGEPNYYGFQYGRGSLNVDSLAYHGTIEIRQHEGTMNPDEAVAWVLFGQRFVEHVLSLKYPMRCAVSAASMLNTLKVPAPAKRHLRSKAQASIEALTAAA